MSGFVHLELNSTDLKKAQGFYSKIFGWKFDDMQMPDGVYSMVKDQMQPGIGLQSAAMPGMPSSWIGYVEVADVKKTVARAQKAGAEVTVPYFAVPGMGEGAWLIDPTGAPVAIWHSLAPAKKKSKKKAGKKAAKKAAKKKAAKKKAGKKKAGKGRKATKRR